MTGGGQIGNSAAQLATIMSAIAWTLVRHVRLQDSLTELTEGAQVTERAATRQTKRLDLPRLVGHQRTVDAPGSGSPPTNASFGRWPSPLADWNECTVVTSMLVFEISEGVLGAVRYQGCRSLLGRGRRRPRRRRVPST